MITSILDTDLYKLTQQQAVLELYPNTIAEYKFINRRKTDKFSKQVVSEIKKHVHSMQFNDLILPEENFLYAMCPFFKNWYFDYLRNYKYNPDHVEIKHENDQLDITVHGPWHETILWEVPLMSIISESYFQDYQIDYKDYENRTIEKGKLLAEAGVKYFEFGTRRRRSKVVQKIAINALKNNALLGVSNIALAFEYGLKPIGTVAHEWIMAHSVLSGLKHANRHAMESWIKVYRGDLGIALTDTYGTNAFFNDFDLFYAKIFDGVRHDSGDPFEFALKTINHYKKLGIDPNSKSIIFSDNLNVEKAIKLNDFCHGKIKSYFGIGTNFSNDVPNQKSLNIVIKLTEIDGNKVVKLGDDPLKASGDETALKIAKHTFYGDKI